MVPEGYHSTISFCWLAPHCLGIKVHAKVILIFGATQIHRVNQMKRLLRSTQTVVYLPLTMVHRERSLQLVPYPQGKENLKFHRLLIAPFNLIQK